LNEKVRSGSKWSDIITFIQSAQNYKFDIEIHTVVHLNNWHGLQDLSTFIQQYKLA